MKPLLSSGASMDSVKKEMNEWQDLIMDTYMKLKEDSSQRQVTDAMTAPAHRNGNTETIDSTSTTP
jgi:hypothetical protein